MLSAAWCVVHILIELMGYFVSSESSALVVEYANRLKKVPLAEHTSLILQATSALQRYWGLNMLVL